MLSADLVIPAKVCRASRRNRRGAGTRVPRLHTGAQQASRSFICRNHVIGTFVSDDLVEMHAKVATTDPPSIKPTGLDLVYHKIVVTPPARRETRDGKLVRLLRFTHRYTRRPSRSVRVTPARGSAPRHARALEAI